MPAVKIIYRPILNGRTTVYHAEGAFTHHEKTVIMTTMKRSQALKLRNYIRAIEPTAFMLISNSSEIIGKGFLAGYTIRKNASRSRIKLRS